MTRKAFASVILHSTAHRVFDGDTGLVYLLHFPNDLHGRRHYIGWTTVGNFETRQADHATGRGARITAALSLINSEYQVARLWIQKDKSFERVLKQRGHYWKHCLCNPDNSTRLPYATIRVDIEQRKKDVAARTSALGYISRLQLGIKKPPRA